MIRSALSSTEWTMLALRVTRDAAAEFPDLRVRHEAGRIEVGLPGTGTVGGVLELAVTGERGRVPRFQIARSPASAHTVQEARALIDGLQRVAECGKWLERRLDFLVLD
jgi:hypothetical protein